MTMTGSPIGMTLGSLPLLLLLPAAIDYAATATADSIDTRNIDSTLSSKLDVQYSCIFENLWTKERHPSEYPLDAMHWKKQVLASHSDAYSMWESGALASNAVDKMVESSDSSILTREVMINNGSYEVGYAKHIEIDNTFEFENPIRMTSTNHYLSVVAKMAPSPDWFSGFHDFNAINEATSTWYEKFTIETYPYDAGIDDGDTYYTENLPTIPAQRITQFTVDNVPNGIYLNPSGTGILPVAKYVCSLITDEDDYPEETIQTIDSRIPASQDVKYLCVFENQWSASRHPKHFPTGDAFLSVHWTKQILVAHDSSYSMWQEGSFASKGVEKLAELGGVSDIVTELRDHDYSYGIGYDKYVYSQDPTVTFDPLTMTWNRRYISVLSKLAPSPDWFAGFHDFDAVDENTNTWYQQFIIPLFSYDAGTEDGINYDTVNKATDPVQPISKFTTSNGDNVFMKGNTILCVASLVCTLFDPEEDRMAPTVSPINESLTRSPTGGASPPPPQQQRPSVVAEPNKNAGIIIGVTIGAIVAVLVAGILVCMLLCRRQKEITDTDSTTSNRRREQMIQKIRANFIMEDASTISTHDHFGNMGPRIHIHRKSSDVFLEEVP